MDSICPDSVNGSEWTFGQGKVTLKGETIILDKSVTVDMLVIKENSKLIFKDLGPNSEKIVLRAKAIKV